MSSEESRSCRGKPGSTGPQRVLKEGLGTLVQALNVCDADAGYCSNAGERPVCFQPKLLAGPGWLVLTYPCRHQAKRRRNATATLGLVPVRVSSGIRP